MPIKKFKATVHNTGPGDVVIQSSTSYYGSRGLVQKTKVSTRASSTSSTPKSSPSKARGKTYGLTPSYEQVQGFDFDAAMVEPLKLPQSKVRQPHSYQPKWGLSILLLLVTKRLY